MSKQVKTSGDWMNLFLGQQHGANESHYMTGSYRSSASSRLHSSGYVSRTTPTSSEYSHSRYSPPADYSASRYSREAISEITSPTSYRRSHSYSSPNYSRYVPQYSRWTSSINEDDSLEDRGRITRQSRDSQAAEQSSGRHNESSQRTVDGRDGQHVSATRGGRQAGSARGRQAVAGRSAVVLNQGTIIIRRERAVSTSDEEEKEVESEEEREPSPPPRDPLEVEEEELTSKLQTGFLMSLPEEEQARRRLLEIRQIRANPELFKPENSRGWKFSQLTADLGKPSPARIEEEKILLLRLQSRGISEVEQTDVQVRLQEIWRDRKDELDSGVSRLEQEYEHHLTESSTEISELEGSIQGKHSMISKLQEELLVLTMRKERIAADMEKVTGSHQERMETLRKEMEEIDEKSSQYSVIKKQPSKEESSLPEAERSDLESELECPVCLEISRPPIYQCGEGHIICSTCKPLLRNCCLCESRYSDPPIRCRLAEKLAEKYFKNDDHAS